MSGPVMFNLWELSHEKARPTFSHNYVTLLVLHTHAYGATSTLLEMSEISCRCLFLNQR